MSRTKKPTEYRIVLPGKVRLVGKDYLLIENTSHLMRMGAFGTTSNLDATIDYSLDQSITQLRDTVLHEIIHAVDFSMYLGLEERQVHALAAGLLGVLRDNPQLTQFLTQGDPEAGQEVAIEFVQGDGSVSVAQVQRSIARYPQHVRTIK